MQKLLIGCDPEVFVQDPSTKTYLSAHGRIKGDKWNPEPVNYGAVQVDGMAAEFNIHPAETEDMFAANVRSVFDQLKGMVKGLDLVATPAVLFDKRIMDAAPKEARELGCNPDFNAWIGDMNEAPDGDSTTLRTGSGHIHLGWTQNADIWGDEHLEDCKNIVKQLDYVLGIYSLWWDPDPKRRQLYGRAGCMRPKPYGVEYRVLSNVWLRDERLTRLVYRGAVKAVTDYWNGIVYETKYGDKARVIIDTNDTSWYGHFGGIEPEWNDEVSEIVKSAGDFAIGNKAA